MELHRPPGDAVAPVNGIVSCAAVPAILPRLVDGDVVGDTVRDRDAIMFEEVNRAGDVESSFGYVIGGFGSPPIGIVGGGGICRNADEVFGIPCPPIDEKGGAGCAGDVNTGVGSFGGGDRAGA